MVLVSSVQYKEIGKLKKKILNCFSDQCKEIEENNRMQKTRDLFKKIRDTKVKVKSLSLVQLFEIP